MEKALPWWERVFRLYIHKIDIVLGHLSSSEQVILYRSYRIIEASFNPHSHTMPCILPFKRMTIRFARVFRR